MLNTIPLYQTSINLKKRLNNRGKPENPWGIHYRKPERFSLFVRRIISDFQLHSISSQSGQL